MFSPTTSRRLLLLALVATSLVIALSGCAANSHGWDEAPTKQPLPAVIVKLDRAAIPSACQPYPHAMGCARRDYAAGLCFVFIPTDAQPWLVSHELLHCAGYQHPIGRIQ